MNNNKITIKDLETKLWKTADTLRGNLSAEDYMHVVLGILTLKFINDKNEIAVQKLIKDGLSLDMIDKSDLNAEDAFVVPEESKWSNILKKVGTSEIGFALDEAIFRLGEANPELKGIFNASYNDSVIDKTRLGEVVKIFQSDNLGEHGEDILGRIYEYFLGNFFLKRGQKGGEFYTPRSIVRLITLFIEPTKGKIYDPCCGTAGMLVQAKQFIEEKKIDANSITVYGQEFNNTTWKLAKLNLLLNGLSIINRNELGEEIGALGEMASDTFSNDQHKGEVFDFVMANPPFNQKVWWNNTLEGDPRWKYGVPPKNNANFAWLQHILYKLSTNGKAGVVLANGSLTSTTNGEDKIREQMIKADKISCIVSLPDKLFFTTGISASIWFFDNNKQNKEKILMIDATELGQLVEGSKKNKELKNDDLNKLADIYKKFNNKEEIDIPGLAKSVGLKELEENNFLLSPGRYITINEENKKDPEEIKKELNQAIEELLKLMDESKELEEEVKEVIKKINKN